MSSRGPFKKNMCYSEWVTHGHDSPDVIPARIVISGQQAGGKRLKGGGERHQECCKPLGYSIYCTWCLSAPWFSEDWQGLESGVAGYLVFLHWILPLLLKSSQFPSVSPTLLSPGKGVKVNLLCDVGVATKGRLLLKGWLFIAPGF